jgi:hypothetical protein
MEIIIRGKSFEIDFVSNYVHEKYSELTELIYELIKGMDTTEIQDTFKTDQKKAKELTSQLEEKRKKYTKQITELRREIVFELIDSNGIVYDESWWQKRTSPDDINQFMLDCVHKDLGKMKESKKK